MLTIETSEGRLTINQAVVDVSSSLVDGGHIRLEPGRTDYRLNGEGITEERAKALIEAYLAAKYLDG